MDSTLFEINKHKININNLSNQLNNTFDINQEIFINNEIKNETEILNSLLILKQNSMVNPMINPVLPNIINFNNNNNFVIPLANPNNMNMNNNLPHMQQPQLILENNQKNNNESSIKSTYLVFSSNGGNIPVNCRFDEKFSNVIQRYKIKAKTQDIPEKFIFCTNVISPDITVAKIGVKHGDRIIVHREGDVKG